MQKKIGFILGPLTFIILMLIGPFEGLSQPAHSILSSTLWIAIWWITEAIPIAATALIPIVLFPLLRWIRFISYNSILWTQIRFSVFRRIFNCNRY